MNEFGPYAMQAPPLKRHTRQRFIEFDYNRVGNHIDHKYFMVDQDMQIVDYN